MVGYRTIPLLSLLSLGVVAKDASLAARQTSLDAWIAQERDIAVAGVLANIGPNGALARNASRGVVIAGPGVVNPDYRYSWTRDSALTLHSMEEEFFVGNASLQSTIEDYIIAEAIRQTVSNPMGNVLTPWGTSLGEAKYQINLTRFNGVWGRPQRDGPALRAITLMNYINYLLSKGQYDTAKNVVWPIVANDLSYTAQYWNQTGYDLWEEVAGSSFFTVLAQHRALVQGSTVAARLGYNCTGCASQAPQIACYIASSFWNETGNHIIANIDTTTTRSGIDANYLLGSIEIFDIDGACDDTGYQPCSSRMLASHKAYVDSFRSIYPINAGKSATVAVATGRYAEDTYYGGNPWYLCTLSAAELLYDAAAQFRRQGVINIDQTSLAFFQQIYPNATTGAVQGSSRHGHGGSWHRGPRGSSGSWGIPAGDRSWSKPSWAPHRPGTPASSSNTAFENILSAMTTYADGFVEIVQQYAAPNGSLSEQYNRTTGEPLSAYALTWSFASFVSMAQRRAGQYPASWGSRGAAATPSSCEATSAMGTYAAATAAGAPAVSDACTVQVTFVVNASTTFGQNVYVSGNVPALGNWAPDFEPMATPNYPLWYAITDLSPNTVVSYKYVHQNTADYTFEVQNRTVNTGPCGDGLRQISTNDAWSDDGTVVTQDFCNPDVTHCW